MAHQMAAMAVTLNDLEGHSPVATLSNAVRRTFVQHFTQCQLTVCSHCCYILQRRSYFRNSWS